MKANAKAKTAPVKETAVEKPVRTKANYDVVCGEILKVIKTNPGITLNGLNDNHFGVLKSDKNTEGPGTLKFPVIYQATQRLIKAENVLGTGAKKNQGLYDNAKDALANKPEPTATVVRKSDQPYTLSKMVKDNKWRTIEGNDEKAPIMKSYETASSVKGSIFKVTDNTGDEPKVLVTNEVTEKPKAKAKAPVKAAAKKETAKG